MLNLQYEPMPELDSRVIAKSLPNPMLVKKITRIFLGNNLRATKFEDMLEFNPKRGGC